MNGPPLVVFDTNILFSAVGWRGNPHHCIQAAREGSCISVTCDAILKELIEKLELKRGFTSAQAHAAADEIRAFSKSVGIPGVLKVVSADPDDDAVLECAVTAQAQYVVSGDRHLLDLGTHETISIMKAAEFLAVLRDTAK